MKKWSGGDSPGMSPSSKNIHLVASDSSESDRKENRRALRKALRILEEFRAINPAMPIQHAATYLVIAIHGDDATQADIMEALHTTGPATSRNTRALGEETFRGTEGYNLVSKTPDPEHGLRYFYKPSTKGRMLSSRIKAILED